MRQFEFLPGYYEWHLYDKETNQLLHVMANPVEELVYKDENGNVRDITPEELHWLCYEDLEYADSQYQAGESYNGLTLSDIDSLDEQEMAEAADVMFNALKSYYFEEKTENIMNETGIIVSLDGKKITEPKSIIDLKVNNNLYRLYEFEGALKIVKTDGDTPSITVRPSANNAIKID